MRALIVMTLSLCLVMGVACGGGSKTKSPASTAAPAGTTASGAGSGASATQPPAATQASSSSGAVPDACKAFTEPQVKAAMTEDVAKKTAASSIGGALGLPVGRRKFRQAVCLRDDPAGAVRRQRIHEQLQVAPGR